MGSYYFALSSLPYLSFTGDRYPAEEEFLEVASQWCEEGDYALLVTAGLEPGGDEAVHPLVLKFHHWEMGLRNELVRQRAANLQRDGQGFVHRDEIGDDFTARSGLSEAVRNAVQAESPLKADEALDRLRWQHLDELEVGQFFNIEQMIVYYLRLQILLRRGSFTVDQGREAFNGHYESVHARMQESQKFNGEQA